MDPQPRDTLYRAESRDQSEQALSPIFERILSWASLNPAFGAFLRGAEFPVD